MMADQWAQIERLFETALEQPPQFREAWLAEACLDPGLRHEVAQMLSAREQVAHFLEEPAHVFAESLLANDEATKPRRVGPYRLLSEISRGGMGVVYLAERADGQYEQQVAVKVLRRILFAGELHRRFLAERQILASLKHPNIARLLDGGVTEEGQPYFVMEYVEGLSIDAFCRTHSLSLEDRLRLFITVCEAVRYAHQKLIVHRDLKPMNILVAQDGRVKLLDFGIAKLLDAEAAASATQTGMHLMTPEYASPEQVSGAPISTASDVYQLGLLLYELLVGQPAVAFETRALAEIARVVCQEEPLPPSQAVDGKEGSIRPKRLRGELDAMVTNALRKEPERRYASAGLLAEDLQRYLDGRPVQAHADTLGYRLRTFVRRNKAVVTAGVLVVLLLMGYAATVSIQARTIAAERNRTQASVVQAERVQAFLIGLFEQADPGKANRNIEAALTVLEPAAATIATELAGEPEVQADLYLTLGQIYFRLARPDLAEPMLRQALGVRRTFYGEPHEDVAEALHALGRLHMSGTKHDLDSARTYFREATAMRKAVHPGDDAGLARSMLQWARLLPHDHPDKQHRKQEVFAMYERLNGRHSIAWADALHEYYVFGFGTRDEEEVLNAFTEVLSIYEEELGMHLKTATVMHNLGLALGEHTEEGMERLLRSVEIAREAVGLQHPRASTMAGNVGATLHEQGRFVEADTVLAEVVLARRKTMPGSYGLSWALTWHGRNLLALGHLKSAEEVLREAHTLRQQLAPEKAMCDRAQRFLGHALARREKYREGARLLEESYAQCADAWGADSSAVRQTLEGLIALYDAWGRPDVATGYRATLDSLAF